MTDEQFKEAEELRKLMEPTRKALEAIENWQASSMRSNGSVMRIDNNYNVVISEFGDGSGKKLVLHRYYGNTRLLEVIRKELEAQLGEFEKEYAEI